MRKQTNKNRRKTAQEKPQETNIQAETQSLAHTEISDPEGESFDGDISFKDDYF